MKPQKGDGQVKVRDLPRQAMMFDLPLTYEMKHQMDITRRQRARIQEHQRRTGKLSVRGVVGLTPEQSRAAVNWPALERMTPGPPVTFEPYKPKYYEDDTAFRIQEVPGGNEFRITSLMKNPVMSAGPTPVSDIETEMQARGMLLRGEYDSCYY